MEIKGILDEITAAEYEAAKIMLQAHDIIGEKKTDARNVVTEYDRKVQKYLVERFSALVPGAHFFCEESDHPDSLNAEHVFIIDPIDGTMNFVRGFNHSCICVAYSNRGVISAAAVYNPYVDEMFTALKGEGAYLNGRRLHISDCTLAESIACIGTSPYDAELYNKTMDMSKILMQNCLDIRRSGSAELDQCDVAAGRAGIYFELRLSLWDYAAGSLIAEEAGALSCGTDGAEPVFDGKRRGIVCGAPAAVRQFFSMFTDI